MNPCRAILQEIHRRVSDSVQTPGPGVPPPDTEELRALIRRCLDAHPPPETVRVLTAALGSLEGEALRGTAARPLLRMHREVARLLEPPGPSPRLSQPARYLKGVGERGAQLLSRLDIRTVEDLLLHFPHRYEDRRNLKKIAQLSTEEQVTLQGTVLRCDLITTPRKRFRIFQAMIQDATGVIPAKWFNQAYLQRVLRPGQRILVSGRVKRDPYGPSLEIENPEYEILREEGEETIHTNRIVPIYPTTAGLSQRRLRGILFRLLTPPCPEIPEVLPGEILSQYRLPGRRDSLLQLHFPEGEVALEKWNAFASPYHKRMIFEEFLLLEMLLALYRQGRAREVRGISFQVNTEAERDLVRGLPFPLTAAQARVIREIKRDMGRPVQMNRLLQGDVGCGKTVVAAAAAGIAMENGYQVAVMAPTEILAEQLHLHFRGFFQRMGRRSALLTRMVRPRERESLREEIHRGEVDVVVGTQALIQEEVSFRRLGLVIIDEQHRFGVIQRASLVAKGKGPDILVMTATPIPRSLSLTVYGDLDVSVIDEMPPGRTPVRTEIVRSRRKPAVYRRIERELQKGRQAYIIYPLVEETEKSDLAAATEMSERLASEIFPRWKVGLLHGRMKSEDKERIMRAFQEGALHLLVATTVIEVGIDVPNATVMLIEHAERFGLAQLHQLRGRVGRGPHPSFCYLVAVGRISEEGRRRLAIMARTCDGFRIAEEDLAIRGPGEYFGKRQSGIPNLRIGNLLRDARILEAAREEAFGRIRKDPRLEDPGNRLLLAETRRRYADKTHLIRAG